MEKRTATKVKTCTRRYRSGNIKNMVPEGLPVEVVEHRLPEDQRPCPVCGEKMAESSKEVYRFLKIKWPEFSIQEDEALHTAPKLAWAKRCTICWNSGLPGTFLEDGRLELSNSRAERSISPLFLSRSDRACPSSLAVNSCATAIVSAMV